MHDMFQIESLGCIRGTNAMNDLFQTFFQIIKYVLVFQGKHDHRVQNRGFDVYICVVRRYTFDLQQEWLGRKSSFSQMFWRRNSNAGAGSQLEQISLLFEQRVVGVGYDRISRERDSAFLPLPFSTARLMQKVDFFFLQNSLCRR